MTAEVAPRTYVLDTGIIVALQRAGHLFVLVDISERAVLVILEEVRDELIDNAPPKHARYAEQVRITLGGSQVRIEAIDASDPAAALLDALRAGKTSDADLGEAASIAWAMSRPEVVFVTRDTSAALRALEELRGRAMGFFQFLAELVESGALDASVATKIAEDVTRADGVSARAPLWWSGWADSHLLRSPPAPPGDLPPRG